MGRHAPQPPPLFLPFPRGAQGVSHVGGQQSSGAGGRVGQVEAKDPWASMSQRRAESMQVGPLGTHCEPNGAEGGTETQIP